MFIEYVSASIPSCRLRRHAKFQSGQGGGVTRSFGVRLDRPRAPVGARLRRVLVGRLTQAGQAEIGDDRSVVRVEQDVVRLQVSVENAKLQLHQGSGQYRRDEQRGGRWSCAKGGGGGGDVMDGRAVVVDPGQPSWQNKNLIWWREHERVLRTTVRGSSESRARRNQSRGARRVCIYTNFRKVVRGTHKTARSGNLCIPCCK